MVPFEGRQKEVAMKRMKWVFVVVVVVVVLAFSADDYFYNVFIYVMHALYKLKLQTIFHVATNAEQDHKLLMLHSFTARF